MNIRKKNKITATSIVTVTAAIATTTTDDSNITVVAAAGSTTFVSASPSYTSIITRARSSLRQSPSSKIRGKSKFIVTSGPTTTNTNNNRSSSSTTATSASSTTKSRTRLVNVFSGSNQQH